MSILLSDYKHLCCEVYNGFVFFDIFKTTLNLSWKNSKIFSIEGDLNI